MTLIFPGCGGSTLYVISELEKKYGLETLSKWRVLLLNAGGQSQRLPSASVLGKIFTALPFGSPMYQILESKLASYLPFLARMAPGIFHGSSDTIEISDLGDLETWDFKQEGFTALAHPSSLSIGTGHGVYILEENGPKTEKVEQRICLQVLQKPSVEEMRKKKAVLGKGSQEFVYTDSVFFFHHNVTQKLLEFYRKEGPFNCEIDSYGDFLQALGPSATVEYTRNTANVGKVEPSLVETREKIFHLLRGTPLHVVALNASEFLHFGTIDECLDHFVDSETLQSCLSFKKWVCSKKLLSLDANGESSPKKQKLEIEGSLNGCIMHSCITENSSVSDRCIVEYCNFEVPVNVGKGCLISNCEVLSGAVPKNTLEIPDQTFLHTVPIKVEEGKVLYVTIAYLCQENIKKTYDKEKMADINFMGKPLSKLTKCLGIDLGKLSFKSDTISLWHMQMFPSCDSMSESFVEALSLVRSLASGTSYDLSGKALFSMADVMEVKDVEEMLVFRNKLLKNIV